MYGNLPFPGSCYALKDAQNRIKLHTKRPNIVCNWGSALNFTGSLRRSLRPLVDCVRGHLLPIPLHSLDAFDAVVGRLQGQYKERWTVDTPNFGNVAAPLVTYN